MKKIPLLATLAIILLLAIGCQQPKDEDMTYVPPAVEDLQNQKIPESVPVVPKEETVEQDENDTPEETPQTETALYRGSWFDIRYPQSFTAAPTTPTTEYNGNTYVQTDEAYFSSPNGDVEFFVYSPLWAGEPSNYLTVGPQEEIVSEKTETGEALPGQLQDSQRIIKWVTIKAKDGSYYRSYVSIREQVTEDNNGSEIHHVFGIKYKDNDAYEQFKDDYIAFKDSLRQYAD